MRATTRAICTATGSSPGDLTLSSPLDDVALAIVETYLPDLIVTELRAPGLDGLRLLRRLRTGVVTRDIPVIVLTAMMDRRLLLQARAAGADVLPKLAGFDVMETRIAALPSKSCPEDLRERRRRPLGLARMLRSSRSPAWRES
jgi:CheY-like chemotaxis protein